MPPVLAAITAAGTAISGALATTVLGFSVGTWIAGGLLVYGQVQQQRAKKRARNAYNDGLTDRTVTYTDANAPWQVVYGTAVVGGRVVAQLTSGDRDQFQHVVVAWADHESDAIEETLLAGVPLGTLDSNGYVTSGKYFKPQATIPTATRTLDGAGSCTLPVSPESVLSLSYTTGGDSPEDVVLPGTEVLVAGNAVTVKPAHVAAWAGRTVQVSYSYSGLHAKVRVRHHLGGAGQTADTATMDDCPGDWTSTDVLAGKTYSVFRFDLSEPEFQPGPPLMQVRMRGKKVYDHRTDTTAWSANAALCTADFLRGEYGKAQPSNALLWASVDSAANTSDEVLSIVLGVPRRRYTCNGAFSTDADPDDTLTALCQAMAGFATFSGAWHLQAGAYTAPVMDLTDADNMGSVEVIECPEGQEMVTGMRGQIYDMGRYGQRTDYTPYSNSAFVAADGGENWGSLNLPFTSSNWRAHNLARIQTERSRGMQLLYPAKLRAVRLRVGQRVTLTNALLNLDAEVFRVVRKQFRIGGPVLLTLAQDAASYYDEADAPADLDSPTAPAVDPWVVPYVAGFSVDPGAGQRDTDGTVISRARASWTPSTNPYVENGGALQIEVRLTSETDWTRLPEVNPNTGFLQLPGLLDARAYLARARWRNALGAEGDWVAFPFTTALAPLGPTWDSITGAGKPASYATVGKSLGLPFESWTVSGGQYVATIGDGKVGNRALRLLPAVGAYPNQGNYTPIDRTKKYRVRFWARPQGGADGLLYFSLRQFVTADPAGYGPVNGGRSPYTPSGYSRAMHNTQFGGSDQWGEYSHVWDASYWQTGVQFVQPEFLDNYGGTTGWWEAQDFTFEEVTEVVAAADAAAAAQADADAANTALAAIADDNWLTRGEKPRVVLDYTAISDEFAGILAQATAYGVTTEKDAYSAAVGALGTYLSGLSPGWNNTAADTPISGSTFRANFAAVYAARQAVLNAVAAVAGTLATWAGVSGSGKPADNATRNAVTYGSSAPGSPVDGDLWVDTGGTYAVFKLRSGGAWVTGANALSAYNALSGTPVALADINTTESAKLAGIAAGATVNRWTYSSSAPGSPVDGDIWVDTSGAPYVVKLRVGGAWQTGANLSTGALAQLNSVDTAEIAAGAVIDAAVVSVASFTATDAGDGHSPDGEGWREAVISMTYTPPVNCKVLLQCTGLWDYTTASGGSGWLGLAGGVHISGAWSSANDSYEFYEHAGTGANRRGYLIALSVFALSAGTTYTFKLLMRYQNVYGGDVIDFSSLNLSRTVYKR